MTRRSKLPIAAPPMPDVTDAEFLHVIRDLFKEFGIPPPDTAAALRRADPWAHMVGALIKRIHGAASGRRTPFAKFRKNEIREFINAGGSLFNSIGAGAVDRHQQALFARLVIATLPGRPRSEAFRLLAGRRRAFLPARFQHHDTAKKLQNAFGRISGDIKRNPAAYIPSQTTTAPTAGGGSGARLARVTLDVFDPMGRLQKALEALDLSGAILRRLKAQDPSATALAALKRR